RRPRICAGSKSWAHRRDGPCFRNGQGDPTSPPSSSAQADDPVRRVGAVETQRSSRTFVFTGLPACAGNDAVKTCHAQVAQARPAWGLRDARGIASLIARGNAGSPSDARRPSAAQRSMFRGDCAMDGKTRSISPHDLHQRLGTAASPLVIDVRRADAFRADDKMIAGAVHRAPEQVGGWAKNLPAGRPVVAYCVHGHEVSQGAAAALRAAGVDAVHLDGGIAGWTEHALPTRKKLGPGDDKWVTRERPKVDRIACPWLIARFINPEAEFIYVPVNQVLAVAKQKGATPYDI